MALTVKCYATLAGRTPPGGTFPPEPGLTVAGLVAALGLDPEAVKVAFVNGQHATPETPLRDGDRVGLFPAVGGG